MLIKNSKPLYVITGGPGSGKTTLINALASKGYAVVREAGRAVIQEQLANNGQALPWLNPEAFANAMFAKDLQAYQQASKQMGIVFFDRGLADICGYLMTINQPIATHIQQATEQYLYNKTVFIAPYWAEIFQQDQERKQTAKQAEDTYKMMRQVYSQLGYTLVELPKTSVAKRVEFIEHYLANNHS